MSLEPELVTLQNDAVQEFAKSVIGFWERIVVHYEILDSPESRAQSEYTIIVQRDADNTHSLANFEMSEDARSALLKLRDATTSETGEKWSTCVLIVDPPGAYKFSYSYDPPKVLNGVIDEEYKFYRKYLPHYLKEKGLTA